VAGGLGERFADIEWALRVLSERFATVVWAPGNHELWTHPDDVIQLRGEQRYARLVALCRRLGVLTPEDTWHDGVRFEEVSLGYPREWQARGRGPGRPRQVLPVLRNPA
jgi:hypothetical protein